MFSLEKNSLVVLPQQNKSTDTKLQYFNPLPKSAVMT